MDSRVERTVEIHRELMDLWGVDMVYGVHISVTTPDQDAYDGLGIPEMQGGTDKNIPLKKIDIDGGKFDTTSITIYAPKS